MSHLIGLFCAVFALTVSAALQHPSGQRLNLEQFMICALWAAAAYLVSSTIVRLLTPKELPSLVNEDRFNARRDYVQERPQVHFVPRVRRKAFQPQHEMVPVSQTEGGRLYAKIASGICPDCGEASMFESGPSGGIAQNIKCVRAGHRFNIIPMVGTADRI